MADNPLALIVQKDQEFFKPLLSGSTPECYTLYVTDEFIVQPVIFIEGKYQLDKAANLVFNDSENRLRGIKEGIRRGLIKVVEPASMTEEEIRRIRDAGRAYEAKNEEIRGLLADVLKRPRSF